MTTIRDFEPGDLAACRELWVELTEQHRHIYGSPTIGGDDPGMLFDRHLQRVGSKNIWVAVEDGEVVGLTGLLEKEQMVEVEPLVVTASRRGSGIGRALVDHVITVARQRGISLLSVVPVARNREAIRFYRQAGFDVLGFVEMFMDLSGEREWIDGETLAGEDFRV